ncbi:HCLS1-associated protein X-1 [Arapaima gigas]
MSVFDLFRGFFGVPGGRYGGDNRRDSFFDGMTRDGDDDDDDEDDQSEAEYFSRGYWGWQQDPFDEALRFNFSFGPSGLWDQEPQLFDHIFKQMEELFSSSLGSWEQQPGFGYFGIPQIEPAPLPDNGERGYAGPKGNSLRDFMLKSPDSSVPSTSRQPSSPLPSFPHRGPFSKFSDLWSGVPRSGEEADSVREDRDLDSKVSSEGLDQILTPPTSPQPKIKSFSQSVTITKVVAPDGTVEERRTVRDSHGNEKTTITRSGGSADSMTAQKQQEPPAHGIFSSSGLQDDFSIFSKFFGGFRR